MQQIELLRMQNKIVFLFLTIAIFTYCFLAMLGLFGNLKVLVVVLLLFFIPIIVGKMLKVQPIVMQWLIIICGNISIFYMNVVSLSFVIFMCFIFYILLMTIYQSLKVSAILSIGTLLEIIFLSYQYQVFTKISIDTPYFIAFIFAVLLLMTICCIQTKYMKCFWYKFSRMNLENEQKKLSQEAYLHLFFEHANDCIAVFDLENRIIDINPAFEEVYGWKRFECIGKVITLVPPENKIDADNRYFDLLKGKSVKLLKTKDMRKDGTVFNVAISLSPIYDRNGKMVAISVISRDISHEKENERLILQSEKLKLTGAIAAGVAHEVRNPLTAISGFVQMMNNDKDSPYHAYTEIIQSEIERIDLIISEFLVLSKLQAEQLKNVSIDDIVKNISNFFHLEFLKYGITFSLNMHSHQNIILANENKLKQVFINIIKNAIDAIDIHDVQGVIDLSIHRDAHNTIHISIFDNGIGMSENLLTRVFEPFYTTKADGTGLGMIITNKIIQDHGGKIEIDSKVNSGTTIHIKLPAI